MADRIGFRPKDDYNIGSRLRRHTIVERVLPTVTMELPADVFSTLRRSPDEFAREMRLAAAMLWYSRGMISQERAAEIAGLNRAEFLRALARNEMDVLVVDCSDLERELDRG